MAKYLVPVFYTMAGDLLVEATDKEEAMARAQESDASIHELHDSSYCDDSWEVGEDPDAVRQVPEPDKELFRLWWYTNPPCEGRKVFEGEGLHGLRQLVLLASTLAAHELALGDMIHSNASIVERYDPHHDEWEDFDDDQIKERLAQEDV